jgi:hypothetical protein
MAFLLAAAIAGPATSQTAAGGQQLTEARKVVDLVYPPGSYAATFRTAMRDFMAKQGGGESADFVRKANQIIDDEAAKLGQQQEPIVRDQMVKMTTAKFSVEELVAIRTFLESPAGRKYSMHLPEITAVLESPEQAAAMMVATAQLSEKLEQIPQQ